MSTYILFLCENRCTDDKKHQFRYTLIPTVQNSGFVNSSTIPIHSSDFHSHVKWLQMFLPSSHKDSNLSGSLTDVNEYKKPLLAPTHLYQVYQLDRDNDIRKYLDI